VDFFSSVIFEGAHMSTEMEEDFKRWTSKRKAALVIGLGFITNQRLHQALGLRTPAKVYALEV